MLKLQSPAGRATEVIMFGSIANFPLNPPLGRFPGFASVMRNDTKNLTRAAPDVRKCAGLPVPQAENGNPDNSRYHVPFEMLMNTLRLYSRLLATLLCAIGLAACGGSTTTITIGGAINGLTTSGLTLSNGVNTVAPAANATSYTFSGSVNQGSTYAIAVLVEPTGLTCTFAGKTNAFTGVAGGENVTNADLTCVQSAFNLGGTVTGLTTDGLVLADGNSTVAIPANATTFTFAPAKIVTGFAYGITVLSQPAGLTCSVANGIGIAGTTDVSVSVSCV